MAYKVFTNGSVLNASEVNDNLMNQSVITFATATARSSAITSPIEGMITYLEDSKRYESYNGTAWVQVITPGSWVAFTPTFANFTLGNGTVSARFIRIGRTVIVRMNLTLGSTSSMGSFPNFALPVSASSNYSFPVFSSGNLIIEDTGSRNFLGKMRLTSTTTADFVFDSVSGSSLTNSFLSSTAPMTWAATDKFDLQIIYEAGA